MESGCCHLSIVAVLVWWVSKGTKKEPCCGFIVGGTRALVDCQPEGTENGGTMKGKFGARTKATGGAAEGIDCHPEGAPAVICGVLKGTKLEPSWALAAGIGMLRGWYQPAGFVFVVTGIGRGTQTRPAAAERATAATLTWVAIATECCGSTLGTHFGVPPVGVYVRTRTPLAPLPPTPVVPVPDAPPPAPPPPP